VSAYLPILVRLPDDLDPDDTAAFTAYVLHLLDVLEAGGVEAGLDARYDSAPDGTRLN
jgi:hypothetical protein